ncbi:putative serine/threonine-protein kinase-like protein CCR3 [Carex littledalei]|uniref:Putative serine/threonine-protein kinase-like protein CCR3 n=1 Tax=Carex littledalei TaxID=544730 RepID=A0A833VFS4_9POAL|nr:putative serine/threonine-protein kinase-like protein CCR3 [Carex littledalei]
MVPFHCIVDPTSTTLAISQMTSTVCGITVGSQNHSIQCTKFQESAEFMTSFPINSTFSFDSISGGHNFICSLRSGDTSFFCWDGIRQRIKRVYSGPTALRLISVGARHVATIDGNQTKIRWWRYGCNRHAPRCRQFPKSVYGEYHSLTSGDVFTCAISGAHSVQCWGTHAKLIQRSFAGVQMRSLTAGGDRMCGLNMTGHLICTGNQSNVPSGEAFEFTSLAIGESHTCAIRRNNGTAVCWGQYGSYFPMGSTGFEFLVAGGNLTCGLTTYAFNVACWGLNGRNLSAVTLSLPKILPGVCVPNETFCSCGVYPDSGDLCGGSGVICMRSDYDPDTTDSCPSPFNLPAPSKTLWEMIHKWLGVFVFVCIGFVIVAISMAASKLRWCGVPQVSAPPRQETNLPVPRNPRGPTFPVMDNVQVFSFNELKDATNNFSLAVQIGIGGYGRVYRGLLTDGRRVAVKRCDTRVPDSEAVFQAEVEIQAKARHENVVSLIGYCTENNERLCVFEYMPHKDLDVHLHLPTYWTRRFAIFYSWKLRIKALLDVARGIEYLHQYCVPRIIHRDIKSGNILLDQNWVAKISDFGLAVTGPDPGQDRVDVAFATGTAGYADPDSYNTANPFVSQRTDVYSFGMVMLEVVTGQMVYNELNNTSLATSAAPTIAAGRLMEVLDGRLTLPVGFSMEAVEIVATLAQQCVSPGAQRPNMSDVVRELETAVARFDQQEAIAN